MTPADEMERLRAPDTIEVLACHPSTILTRNTTNAGFAEACNKGIRTARGRHLLLLNPDAVVAPNALEQRGPEGTVGRICERWPNQAIFCVE